MDLRSRIAERKKSLKSCKTLFTDTYGRKFEIRGDECIEVKRGLPFILDEKPDMQIACVLPGLFISSQDPIACLELLNFHKIHHILSLGIKPGIKFNGIKYHFVEMMDLPECDISQVVLSCFQIIHENRCNNILVHCNAGVSRSATIVISYLMIAEKLTYELASERVKTIRQCIKPNDGFVRQLKMLNL